MKRFQIGKVNGLGRVQHVGTISADGFYFDPVYPNIVHFTQNKMKFWKDQIKYTIEVGSFVYKPGESVLIFEAGETEGTYAN